MPEFYCVSPKEFDLVIEDRFFRDEHELLESTVFRSRVVVLSPEVVRYLDGDGRAGGLRRT